MSLAGETRRVVEEHPFLVTALRAGIVNYTACARFLEVEGETEAVATAIRRHAEELPELDLESRTAETRVSMQSGVGPVSDPSEGLLSVGDTTFGPDGGDGTAILVTGAVDARVLSTILQRLQRADIGVRTAGLGEETIVVVVDRLAGADAVRTIERALERIPAEADTSI